MRNTTYKLKNTENNMVKTMRATHNMTKEERQTGKELIKDGGEKEK